MMTVARAFSSREAAAAGGVIKQLKLACVYCVFGVAFASGGPVEDAIVASVRLSNEANYSWTSTIVDDARTYDIQGQTDRSGFTRARMPIINSVRRKMGRSVTDTQIETIFRGNVACVLLTDAGWQRPDELPEPEDQTTSPIGRPAIAIGTSPTSGIQTHSLPSSHVPAPRAEEKPRPYSNLQLAISLPHEELGVIVSSHQTFHVEGDTVTGNLTDLGAQLLLVRDGQPDITPIRAAGSFTLWLRNGIVSHYHLKLEGILEVKTGRSRNPTQILVQQSATTQIRKVGTTQVDIPDEARVKLGSL